MSGQSRRVYAPALGEAGKPPAPPPKPGWGRMIFIVLVGLGSLVFLGRLFFGADAPPIVKAPPAPYKVAAEAPPAPSAPQPSLYDAIEAAAAKPGAPATTAAPATAMSEAQGPQASGAYLVQLAALQSQAAGDALAQRLRSSDPAGFADARFDIQRVESAKGVFYRVRAGYFADWAEASVFCDRQKAKGQECIVVSR